MTNLATKDTVTFERLNAAADVQLPAPDESGGLGVKVEGLDVPEHGMQGYSADPAFS